MSGFPLGIPQQAEEANHRGRAYLPEDPVDSDSLPQVYLGRSTQMEKGSPPGRKVARHGDQ